MDSAPSPEQRLRVEEFQRKHRIALLTMLFTDIVGSARLKQLLGDRAAIALMDRHHAVIREVLARFPEGEEISTAGDSFFIVFAKPSDAAHFALLAQNGVRALARETGQPVLDRIGVHVGEIFIQQRSESQRDLFGMQIDTAARIMSLGSSDQILLSRFAFDNARQVLRGHDLDGVGELLWLNHGYYEMKGVEEPVEVCEVGEVGSAALLAPGDSDKAHRFHSPDAEPVLGWRPSAGQRVPNTPWTLERALGEGGFGEVWLAHHETLKQRRVIKFCFRADRVRSLKREVTLFRILRERVGEQRGIVKVHDVFFDEPPYYIVMDYVDGPNLAEWTIAHAPLAEVPLATRLEIVAQVADALQVAHDAGVIHRDVKPSNILVAEDKGEPQVKLTDFGIGQVVSAEALAGVTKLGFTQTMLSSSNGTGTQLYMAPELFTGLPATTRSDLYSLGVVLYQLIVGDLARPVTGDWADDIADPLLRDDLRKCLAGDPQKRFVGAVQLAANIRALAERRAAAELERVRLEALERRAYRRGILRTTAVAAAVVVAMALLAFYALQQASRAARNARAANNARGEAEKLIEFMTVDLKEKLEGVGRLDLLDGTAAAVESYFDRDAEAATPLGLFRRGVVAENRADVESARGHLGKAIVALESAVGLHRRATSLSPNDHAYSMGLGRSLARLAHFLLIKDDHDKVAAEAAKAAAEQALTLFNALPEEVRSSEQNGIVTAEAFLTLGEIYRAYGDGEQAKRCFDQTRNLLQSYVQRFPNKVRGQVAYARGLARGAYGGAEDSEWRPRIALARKIAGELRERDPENRILWRLAGEIDLAEGETLQWAGFEKDAQQREERAVEVFNRLHSEDPANLEISILLYYTHAGLGYLKKNSGNADSTPDYEAIADIAKAGVERSPDDRFWRHKLSYAYYRIGDNLSGNGQADEAIKFLTLALQIRQAGVDPNALTGSDRAMSGCIYRYLASTESRRKNWETALKYSDLAVEFGEAGLPPGPDSREEGWIRKDRSGYLFALGRFNEAEADAALAVARFQACRPKHFVLMPEKEYGAALLLHADCLAKVGKGDAAEGQLAEAVRVFAYAAEQGPPLVRVVKTLAQTWRKRSELALQRGDRTAFREMVEGRLRSWEQALQRDPNNAECRAGLAAELKECVKQAKDAREDDFAKQLGNRTQSEAQILQPPLEKKP